MADFVADFELEQNNFDADFELENVQFDAVFEINPSGAAWGTITGRITDQTDLINLLNEKVNVSDFDTLSQTVEDDYTDLDGRMTTLYEYGNELGRIVTNVQETINTYGDIVTHDASDFATSEQGALADSSIQPNDNISLLNNDANYVTAASLPTVNNATITIQKNGSTVESFTLNQASNKTINITVPTKASDVGALPNSTNYGASIDLSLNTTDYKLTLTLKDQNGNTLNSKVVDFPIESVVVSGRYDSTNKKIVLTLQNGTTIDIPVGDLVAGLQSEITSTNKLDADLVDDTNTTNKFVTASEKITWNNKQNAITDLSTIRTNATNGTNAYTTIQGYGDIVTHNASEFVTPSRLTTVLADYVLSSDLSTTLADYVTSTNLTTILDDYATKQWTQTNANALYSAIQTWVQNQGYALSSNLATVATSGSYNDLSNKPTIPAAQVQADWDVTDTTSKAYIKNKPYIPSGVVVDQTYDGTSTNAQSGVAIEGAGFLKNTATATNSLTILGTTNNQNNSILIGYGTTTSSTNSTVIGNTAVSGGSYATALGYYARANGQYTTAIGNSSYASYQDTTAVGHNSQATAAGTLAVGSNSKATAQRATSIGYSSQATQYQATALGYEAKATANSALQIGTGTNSTANTLQVGTYTLLNTSTGYIPDARISSNIARTSDIPDISTKQDTLVSGTNIKTINDTSILGSGNINSLVTVSYGSTYFIELRDLYSLSRDIVCIKDLGLKIAHLRVMSSSYFEFVYNDKNSTEIWKIDESDNWTTVSVSHANTTLSNVSSISSSSAVATALDGKADTDLSNLSSTGQKVIDGQWVYNKTQIANNTHLTTTAQTYDMSSYLPNDSYDYEVLLGGSVTSGSSSGNRGYITLKSDISSYVELAYAQTRSNSTITAYGNCIIAVSTGRTLTIAGITSPNNSTFILYIEGYRRIGTNS